MTSIYKITYSTPNRRACLYSRGCPFRCRGCAYKLRQVERPQRFLTLEQIRSVLSELEGLQRVHFLGGDPSASKHLPRILQMCKSDLGLTTWLGHTNGTGLPLANLDGANFSLKAFTPELHEEYTGYPRQPIYDNFRDAYDAGITLRANTVLIPKYIDAAEIGRIAKFVAGVDRGIPFHVVGYMAVPGQPWREPTPEEMQQVVAAAERYLCEVSFSHLSAEEYTRLKASDQLYDSVRVA